MIHLHGWETAGSWGTAKAGAPQISPVCVDMSLSLVGKHCVAAVGRGHEAVGEDGCDPVGGGRSVGGRSLGENSVGENSVGADSVGGRYAAVGGVDAEASAGSLTVVEVWQAGKPDCGRCRPDRLGR